MWSRKRLDISWTDLAAAASYSVTRWDHAAAQRRVEALWADGREALACLSVRSAWDLWLQALDLPAGSEVLMSAITIPDMARIVAHHGLVPVPLELDLDSLVPTPATLRRAVTPRTKAVLVAHLFGTRGEIDGLIDAAHECGLPFIEDCAQAYVGPQFTGHPRADVSLFSFGTIKTATALGGAIARVRDEAVLSEMRRRQDAYPVQPRVGFLRRVGKYAGLKFISQRPWFGLFVRGCRLVGADYDAILNGAVRGFGLAPPVELLRVRPSAPLSALLARRIRRFRPGRLERQAMLGRRLWDRIAPEVDCPGAVVLRHDFWVFPVPTDWPGELLDELRAAGFDATQGQSMVAIAPPADRPELEATVAADLLRRMVYAPLYPALSEAAVDRLADVLLRHFDSPATAVAAAPGTGGRSEQRV